MHVKRPSESSVQLGHWLLVFGKHTQGLLEIAAVLSMHLAHCYVCSQQKPSAPVNSSHQAAEHTSHRLENSPDLRTAHSSTELRQLT